MNTYKKGRAYEDKVASFLLQSGYKILERNYIPNRLCEIDILALDGQELVAVEVKGVDAPWACESIAQKVGYKKRLKIIRALSAYTSSQNVSFISQRLDVVLVIKDRIVHYKNVWQ